MTATPSTGLVEFPLGTEIAGRHRLEERLAIGGTAAIYRAYDTSRRRDVALKLLHEDHSTQRALFESEYRTLASLRHPRIIEVYDYGIHAERLFYTMELLGGEDLRKLSPLPYPVACAYLRDVASSLALVHARGLIHRDVMVQGFEDDTQTTDAVASMFVNVTLFQDPNEARTLPLLIRRNDDIVLVGAVAMLRGEEDLHIPSLAFLEQVAEAIRNVNVK